MPGLESLEETLGPEPVEPVEPAVKPERIPFKGAEIAAFAGIIGMVVARPKSMAEMAAFGHSFHGPIRLSLPAMGVDFQTSVAEALDSLRVGEALAAFGIYKPGGWGGDMGELPPLMRLALGVAVIGYAGFGGVRAVQEFRQQNDLGAVGGGATGPAPDPAN